MRVCVCVYVCVYVCVCACVLYVCRLILAIHRNELSISTERFMITNKQTNVSIQTSSPPRQISVRHISAAHSSDRLERDAAPFYELLPTFRRNAAPSSSTTSGSFSFGPLTAGDQRATIFPSAATPNTQQAVSFHQMAVPKLTPNTAN